MALAMAGLSVAQNGTLPHRFGMIVYPGFQNLDVFGPIDALFFPALDHPINLSMIAYTLDPVSSLIPQMTNIGSTWATTVVPTHTFANPPKDLDVLFIPGGLGNRILSEDHLASLTGYISNVYPSLKYVISVCTGSGLAARSGILDGRNATSNKRAWKEMTPLGPKTNWIAKARWVVDGNVWTASGVTAGIDATFAWIEEVYGKELADRSARGVEHTRVTDSHDDPFADLEGAEDVPPVE
jgi:transcriptional regulator GlxA family with amidase domain